MIGCISFMEMISRTIKAGQKKIHYLGLCYVLNYQMNLNCRISLPIIWEKTLQMESKCYNYKQLYLKYEFPVALVIQDRSQCNSDSSSQICPVSHIQ